MFVCVCGCWCFCECLCLFLFLQLFCVRAYMFPSLCLCMYVSVFASVCVLVCVPIMGCFKMHECCFRPGLVAWTEPRCLGTTRCEHWSGGEREGPTGRRAQATRRPIERQSQATGLCLGLRVGGWSEPFEPRMTLVAMPLATYIDPICPRGFMHQRVCMTWQRPLHLWELAAFSLAPVLHVPCFE